MSIYKVTYLKGSDIMNRAITCKCIIFSIFSLSSVSCFAGDYKTLKVQSLTPVSKVKKINKKKQLLNKINDYIGQDIDLRFFDKKKEGLSVYAKISRISKLGVRYRF